jgi:hypothetical protein
MKNLPNSCLIAENRNKTGKLSQETGYRWYLLLIITILVQFSVVFIMHIINDEVFIMHIINDKKAADTRSSLNDSVCLRCVFLITKKNSEDRFTTV